MNSFNNTRVVAGVIALIFAVMAYVIISVVMIEASKAAPAQEVRSQYREIPKCDKELWLRIKDGCP